MPPSMALSIRWISVAAAAGPGSLWIWLLAVVVLPGLDRGDGGADDVVAAGEAASAAGRR